MLPHAGKCASYLDREARVNRLLPSDPNPFQAYFKWLLGERGMSAADIAEKLVVSMRRVSSPNRLDPANVEGHFSLETKII